MYDAIVIGSRAGGAPTAMLLARHGRRVLLVDRVADLSDSPSGHLIPPAGLARLAGWGLLDRVRATGVPFSSTVRFDIGDVVLEGSPVPVDGIDATVSIRRSVLDPLLTDAAAEAGVDVRLGVTVTRLLMLDDRVVGIQGHDADGRVVHERAPLVVGADGVDSFVARSAGAATHQRVPATTVTVHAHFDGLDLDGLELYSRPGRFVVAAPTSDGLTYVSQQVLLSDGARFEGRVGEAFMETLADVPHLAERVAAAELAEPLRVVRTRDGFVRQAAGRGWALVGDARHHQDPITAQGISDAFADADLLVGAVDAGLDIAMLRYQEVRAAAGQPMFELTDGLADLEVPSTELQQVLHALEGQPEHIARFLGVLAGSVAAPDFFAPESLAAIARTASVAA